MLTPEVDHPKDKQFASTLAHGIRLLQAFSLGSQALGNGELARHLALDRATVSRLAYTWVQLGYLEQDGRRKYRLASGVLRLGYPLLAGMHVRHIARPFMRQLASQVHGTVGIGIRHQAQMVYLDAITTADAARPVIDRGMPIPLLASAMGNAWLAAASAAERAQALNRHRVLEPEAHARYIDRHAAAVKEARSLGYCSSTGRRMRDRFSVAAALSCRVEGQIVVFNCTVRLADGTTGNDLKRELGPRLLETMEKIEAAAGFATD